MSDPQWGSVASDPSGTQNPHSMAHQLRPGVLLASECEQSVCTSSGCVHSRVCTRRTRMCASPRAFVSRRLVCTSCALYDCRLAPWFRVGERRTARATGGFPSPWPCLQEPLSAAFTERAALLGCQDLLRTNASKQTAALGALKEEVGVCRSCAALRLADADAAADHALGAWGGAGKADGAGERPAGTA